MTYTVGTDLMATRRTHKTMRINLVHDKTLWLLLTLPISYMISQSYILLFGM